MPSAPKIQLAEQQQEELVRRIGSRTVAVPAMERAKIIRWSAAGRAQTEIAEHLGIVRQTVRRWEKRFLQEGIQGLEDAPRPGRPTVIGPEKIKQIVRKTTQETPPDSTHWSTRSFAKAMGVSASSLSRIWRKHQLKPHRVRTFKLRMVAEGLD